jgi:hypothetical protein
VSITIRFDGSWGNSPLGRFQWTAAAATFADEAGPVIRDALKEASPVGKPPNDPRPGRLRDAIRYSRSTTAGDSLRLEFTASPPYTRYVIDGTRPHLIEAVASRALHWVAAEGDRFAKRVHHPGTAPNPFPRRAMETVKEPVSDLFKTTMRDALRGKG